MHFRGTLGELPEGHFARANRTFAATARKGLPHNPKVVGSNPTTATK